jgi:hypothetical protein
LPEPKPNDTAPASDTAPAEDVVAESAASLEPVKATRFRVVHGAVSGVAKNKKGELIEHDYHLDQIVTPAQLENNEDVYLIMGAIVPIE